MKCYSVQTVRRDTNYNADVLLETFTWVISIANYHKLSSFLPLKILVFIGNSVLIIFFNHATHK
jgi:hypothetical protein